MTGLDGADGEGVGTDGIVGMGGGKLVLMEKWVWVAQIHLVLLASVDGLDGRG